jgi:hypothetical protein|tara:strand:- start:25 stop:624 length:600 start_codon:yes stop_codon:yes gene_type:complete
LYRAPVEPPIPRGTSYYNDSTTTSSTGSTGSFSTEQKQQKQRSRTLQQHRQASVLFERSEPSMSSSSSLPSNTPSRSKQHSSMSSSIRSSIRQGSFRRGSTNNNNGGLTKSFGEVVDVNPLPYVYTCPIPDAIVRKNDTIICITDHYEPVEEREEREKREESEEQRRSFLVGTGGIFSRRASSGTSLQQRQVSFEAFDT